MVLCFMFFHPGYNFKPNWRHDCQADFAEERCTRKILDGSHWASKLLETCQLCLYTTVTLKSWSQSLREKGPLRPFWFILLDAPLASKIGTWDRSFYKASVLLQFRQCSEVCPKHASEQFPTCIELLLLLSFPSDQLALSRHTEVTAACLASCLYKFTRAFIWCNDCSGCF